ncbi:triphosphoribosyl-dephospho-CoA synthase CitG [Fructilactobacillus sp. Tb1]|uniref:triphosphoribosyl-dephospho-CoA synthase CitG n=1 Tax=Fructilactobacillus sp. Tb1 TaxID=3422304 RepID=UPI003D2C6148
MIKNYKVRQLNSESTAELAVEAMLAEAVTWPKPGLVDPVSNAGHADMNIYTFINSSVTMMPYFKECWKLGFEFQGQSLVELFHKLRPIGMIAEKRMFSATKGVNTHKGIVFILGIMVAALGYVNKNSLGTLKDLIDVEKAMTTGLVKNDLGNLSGTELTAGQKQFQKFGLTGIRGQTEAGFPIVLEASFPIYKASKLSENDKNLLALLVIVTKNYDSNLIKRAHNNEKLVSEIKANAQAIVDEYQKTNSLNRKQLDKLCMQCAKHNLSLGGSADLLILTIFLNKITD